MHSVAPTTTPLRSGPQRQNCHDQYSRHNKPDRKLAQTLSSLATGESHVKVRDVFPLGLKQPPQRDLKHFGQAPYQDVLNHCQAGVGT